MYEVTPQILELRLKVSETLIKHTTPNGIGLALAEVINTVVPFHFFLHAIWVPNSTVGLRISSAKNPDGRFDVFPDTDLNNLREANFGAMLQSREFLSNPKNAGIIQGEALKKISDNFPPIAIGYYNKGIRSLMNLILSHENGFKHLMIISDQRENAFTQEQYETITALLPQIQVGFDNLFKYEKLKREELERKAQLDLMTSFNAQKDIDEMALDAIGKLSDFIPFEYWFQVSAISVKNDLGFRMANKIGGRFHDNHGTRLFNKLNHDPLRFESFKNQHPSLFERAVLFVGENFDALKASGSYFNACHKILDLNSLMCFPLQTLGKVDTVVMAGSIRKYAFTVEDAQAMERMVPYMSMAVQQYFTLHHVQNLTRQLELEKDYLIEEIKSNYNFDEIIGTNYLMKDVFNQVSQVAPTDSTVLILGETGTGKELIARAIHNQSPRKGKVLIKVNCASLPAQLIESELFGHEKGSFTGAIERRIGKFELANGGTIFLDEIGELPLELQSKLLRVLQEREIERIGGKSTISLDVRIIAATNRDLETEVTNGRFRSDLFYRLNVFPIHIPALRERKEDIPLLVTHFLQRFMKKFKRPFKSLRDEVLLQLINYEWPGNIRELENVIEQAVIVGDVSSVMLRKSAFKISKGSIAKSKIDSFESSDSIDAEKIFKVLQQTKGKITGSGGAAAILNMRPSKIEEYEREWILNTLRKTEGRVRGNKGAASLIGVKPTTLDARIKKLQITKQDIFKGR